VNIREGPPGPGSAEGQGRHGPKIAALPRRAAGCCPIRSRLPNVEYKARRRAADHWAFFGRSFLVFEIK